MRPTALPARRLLVLALAAAGMLAALLLVWTGPHAAKDHGATVLSNPGPLPAVVGASVQASIPANRPPPVPAPSMGRQLLSEAVEDTVELLTVDWNGLPIGAANVFLMEFERHPSTDQCQRVMTDAAGRARVSAVAGERLASASKDGHSHSDAVLVKPGAGSHVLVLTPALRITGQVLFEDGTNAGDVLVRANHARGGRAISARTAREGTFSLLVSVPGTWTVHAEVGKRKTTALQVQVPGESNHLVLRFMQGGWIHGVVRTAHGAVASATVTATRDLAAIGANKRYRYGPLSLTTSTGAGGQFSFEVPSEGRYRLVAEDDEGLHTEVVQALIDPDAKQANVVLTILPTAPLTGTVHEANGRPVDDAKVSAMPESGARLFGRRPVQKTDRTGAFLFPNLHTTTRYWIDVQLPQDMPQSGTRLHQLAMAGEQVAFVLAAPDANAPVPIEVLGHDGKELEHMALRLMTYKGDELVGVRSLSIDVDATGQRSVVLPTPLTSGHAILVVPRKGGGYPFVFRTLDLGSDGTLALRMPGHVQCTVLVTGANGQPRAGLEVRVVVGTHDFLDLRNCRGQTDASGVAQVLDLAPGDATVEIRRKSDPGDPLHVHRCRFGEGANTLQIRLP